MKRNFMSRKDILIVILIIIVAFLISGKNFKLVTTSLLGQKIEFETLSGGVRFKTPVGSDVTLSVVSSDVVTVKSVEQEGKDTVVRLSPVAKT